MQIQRSGRVLRDEAMARVDNKEWGKEAEISLHRVMNKLITFTTDDIWQDLLIREIPAPRERRAMGPVVNRAIRAGYIENIGYRQSQRPVRHAGPIAIYRRCDV